MGSESHDRPSATPQIVAFPGMMAIEISQRVGSVALRAEHGTIHFERLSSSDGKVGRHGDDLMPAIDRLFKRLDLAPEAMKAVAISIGPGSFTGLRIAVSTVRMFAETLGVKVISVPSALVAAESYAPPSREATILVALSGKRDTVWATRLQREAGAWTIAGDPGLADADSLELVDASALLGDTHLPDAIRSRCEEAGVPIVEPSFEACACLRAAERMAADGRFTDPLTLLPLYPRPPEAVTIWEARQKNSANRP